MELAFEAGSDAAADGIEPGETCDSDITDPVTLERLQMQCEWDQDPEKQKNDR